MELLLKTLRSKTIIGIILTTIGSTTLGSDLISTFGLTEDTGLTIVDTIIQVVGGLLAVYGRFVAKKPLI